MNRLSGGLSAPRFICSLFALIVAMIVACEDSSGESNQPNPEQSAGEPQVEVSEIDWSSCARWDHDPSGDRLTLYPDDALTQPDSNTRTGLRIDLAERLWVGESSAFVQRLASDLDTLDGWGINAGITMRVTGGSLEPLREALAPTPPDGSLNTESAQALVYMEDPSEAVLPHFPAVVPVALRLFAEGEGLIFEPLRPLKPSTRYGFMLTATPANEVNDGEDELCLAPSPLIAQLLDDELSPRWAARRRALLELAGVEPERVAALSVFTTQSAVDIARDIAGVIRQQRYAWNDDFSCREDGDYDKCTRTFNALKFQDDSGAIRDATPRGEHTLKVYIWRPRDSVDETPTLLFGHGIGGDVDNAYTLDRIINDLSITRIAIDAVEHGEHPSATASEAFQTVINFFALDIPTQTLRALRARDNFRQSTYDKLQLVELLHQDPDINQDGRADLDLNRFGYYGLSLGGIMGLELLSLEPRIDLSILAVPGARLVSVLTDGSVIGDFKPAIYALVGGIEVFNSFTPLAQVLLDAADPGTFAPYVLGSLRGELLSGVTGDDDPRPPHVLMQIAMRDEVVPNSANEALARALALPHLEQRVTPIPLLLSESTPASLNLNGRTAGAFQFDRYTVGTDDLAPSSHNVIPTSRVAREQSRQFLKTWIEDGEPVIIDPYELLNVPPLP